MADGLIVVFHNTAFRGIVKGVSNYAYKHKGGGRLNNLPNFYAFDLLLLPRGFRAVTCASALRR